MATALQPCLCSSAAEPQARDHRCCSSTPGLRAAGPDCCTLGAPPPATVAGAPAPTTPLVAVLVAPLPIRLDVAPSPSCEGGPAYSPLRPILRI
jgi:hypothetical protein